METYGDFENDSGDVKFEDFFQFEDDENLQDTSSITQVCVDDDPDEDGKDSSHTEDEKSRHAGDGFDVKDACCVEIRRRKLEGVESVTESTDG